MSNNGPFALRHPDLGSHNILADDEYNILSIIDWGDAHVLPIEFAEICPDDIRVAPEVLWRNSRFDTDETVREAAELRENWASMRLYQELSAGARKCLVRV